jgi:hypothetical protein
MSTETTTPVGGFAGNPADAFAPASAGGCCGSAPAQAATSETATSTCCGTAAEAQASGGCCGETAKADAIAGGASCCG